MRHIRNIAIIAHVDHGKTTLVDCLLKQSGLFRANQALAREDRIMDNMDLEREKGITIKAKNAAFRYGDCRINLVDTPGHADFGGEVERIMNMVDGALLVVDAAEGPQAQTRFVLRKALEAGAKPIVAVNKIDREHADPHGALDKVFELFISLGATDEQLDFPFVFTSAKEGFAVKDPAEPGRDMRPLFEMIVEHIPPPRAEEGEGFQLLAANLDYSDYVGRIAFGKVRRGRLRSGQPALCRHGDGRITRGRLAALFRFEGLRRVAVEEAGPGEIVGVAGFENVAIGETIVDSEARPALTYIAPDPPTIEMDFAVNDGPLAGKEGRYLTARHLWERLVKETRVNVALRVGKTEDPKVFRVAARGQMQVAILVEQMRREGYEALISRPEAAWKEDAQGRILEPLERVFLEIPHDQLGAVLESLARRKGEVAQIDRHGGMISVEAVMPMRGLIGFETELMSMTRGLGAMNHLFESYGPSRGEIPARRNGSLVSIEDGVATAYALRQIQERGRLFIAPGDPVYKGMVVGENARENDLPVNPCRAKHLTNMRSKGEGVAEQLEPPLRMSLERALEYIGSDEYLEAAPRSLRFRKKILDERLRRRAERREAARLGAG
ncbi:MAG: translational GTPase TypA [Verrucomicrobia bacterium]|nr:translational GTPase TypA [Verrucomicrobiota bacterium]